MKRRIAPVLALGLFAACSSPDSGPTAVVSPSMSSSASSSSESRDSESNDVDGPSDAKVQRERGWQDKNGNFARPTGQARLSANMSYHGGKIMTSATIKAIYWGPSWTNATFVGDKITGLKSFYEGWNNSPIAHSNVEYTGLGLKVGMASTNQPAIIDNSAATGGGSTAAILAEVCKLVTQGKITVDPSGNGYYPVYTDVPRGNAGYCAWHSAGSCGGKPLQFAFFWKLDGDAGCDPGSANYSGHSMGLAALANVSAHELSEAVTDPANPGAWYDASGQENADKCGWVFNAPSTLSNGAVFTVQGNWSNAAYNAGTGYANRSGQKGCMIK